ncbi:MAG: hypothetical protein AAB919_02955 [Patescibacteria group bacterium]
MRTFGNRFLLKVLAPACVFCLAFLLPVFRFSFDTSTLLTVASLTLTILVGFFIAAATTNYLNLQSLLAEEEGGLIILHNLAKLVDEPGAGRIAESIDRYLVASFDFELKGYVEGTRDEFARVAKEVDSIDPPAATPRQEAALSYLQETKSSLFKTRQSIMLASSHIVQTLHWLILSALSVSVVALLFGLRDGSPFLSIIVGLLSVSVYLILVLLYEVDSNFFAEEGMAFLNPQEIFSAIGALPYFPEYAIKHNRVKKLPAEYRVGVYKNFFTSREKEIKVIKRSKA